MPILNAEHLLDQAERLIGGSSAGAPRQADLRRAVSNAYYAIFHAVLTAAADQIVGRTRRSMPLYALVYRTIDHKSLREFCKEVVKPALAPRYARYVANTGFGRNLQGFAATAIDLQDKRHEADYDPLPRVEKSTASLAVVMAREALHRFADSEPVQREAFLFLLLFRSR